MARVTVLAGAILLVSCDPRTERSADQPRVPDAAAAVTAEVGRRGQEGDTVMIFLHHVKADKREDYERWFAEVWAPALETVAKKRASSRPLATAERDLRAIEAAPSGDYIYAYLYDPWVTDTAGPAGGFPAAMLIEAGRSPEDAKQQAAAYRSFITKDEGYMFVQRQF